MYRNHRANQTDMKSSILVTRFDCQPLADAHTLGKVVCHCRVFLGPSSFQHQPEVQPLRCPSSRNCKHCGQNVSRPFSAKIRIGGGQPALVVVACFLTASFFLLFFLISTPPLVHNQEHTCCLLAPRIHNELPILCYDHW